MRPMPTSKNPAVDTAAERYVSFVGAPSPRDPRFAESYVPVFAGSGRAPADVSGHAETAETDPGGGYPVQPSKVQCPPLRDDTLARPRLLDWLAAKGHPRVVFVVAEAGYGQTTLLADFSRRTRPKILWDRLDSHDRDWVAFLSHLVAAGREHDPAFGAGTDALLRQIGAGGPTRQAVTDAFLPDLLAPRTDRGGFRFDHHHT